MAINNPSTASVDGQAIAPLRVNAAEGVAGAALYAVNTVNASNGLSFGTIDLSNMAVSVGPAGYMKLIFNPPVYPTKFANGVSLGSFGSLLAADDVVLTRFAANALALRSGSAEQTFLIGPGNEGLRSNAGEVEAFDSSGNVTGISPHAKDAPSALYRFAPGVDGMRRVINPFRGVVEFMGEAGSATETFAEYNARTGGDLPLQDWDEIEAAQVQRAQEAITAFEERQTQAAAAHTAWIAAAPETRGPEPTFPEERPALYAARPRPSWASPVTRAELDAIVPLRVQAHQLRTALILHGVEPEAVATAIGAIPDATERKLATAQWEYAPDIRRDHPLVASLAAALSLSTSDVDDLFRQSAKV